MSETKPDCYCTLQDLKDLTVLPYGWVMIRRSVGGVADSEDFEIKILGDVDLLAENAELKKMIEMAMGMIDGEREACPFCGEMYWAGRIGHKEDCAFALLTEKVT